MESEGHFKLHPAPAGYIQTRHVLMVLIAVVGLVGTVFTMMMSRLMDDREKNLDKLNDLLAWMKRSEAAEAFMSKEVEESNRRSAALESKLQTLSDGMVEMRQLVGRVTTLEGQTAEHKRRLDAVELAAARIQDSLAAIPSRMDSRFDALQKEQQISSASLKVISDGFQTFQRESDKDKQRLLNLEVGVDQLRETIPPKRR